MSFSQYEKTLWNTHHELWKSKAYSKRVIETMVDHSRINYMLAVSNDASINICDAVKPSYLHPVWRYTYKLKFVGR